MTTAELIKDVAVPLICVALVPMMGYFSVQVINIVKRMERLDSDFHHLKGNYAHAFDAITKEMMEMRTDIKELLRRSYKEEGRKEFTPTPQNV